MLKKFELKNYKNFKDGINIDFSDLANYGFSMDCIIDSLIGKMLIYGRNATGKTNLGKGIMDIHETLFSRTLVLGVGILGESVLGGRESGKEKFLNADSEEDSALFSYMFQFGEDEVIYKYSRFSEVELKNEELIVNGKLIYQCEFTTGNYRFERLDDIGAETANTSRYKQSVKDIKGADCKKGAYMPFLRWLLSNVALPGNSILLKISEYVGKMMMVTARNAIEDQPGRSQSGFYELLSDKEKLLNLEAFLNEMGVDCELELKELPDHRKGLYFKHDRLLPFYETASSGTLALVDLYRRLIPQKGEPSFLYLDEFDAFYHYEMAANVMRFFKKQYQKCQVIMTSHNTNLMANRLMRPDCLFILSGNGSLTALYRATQRELREGHNLEKMYISGEFEKYE